MEDTESRRQIDQMISFILTEAKDKAAEIEAKAQEDFNVEKLKALQTMKDKIRADYRKKAKQLETQRAIAQSTAVNKARLRKMAARQIKINEAVKSGAKSLADTCSHPEKYSKLITDLIVQAMLRLLEPEVLVRCRKQDEKIVQSCLESAEAKYVAILQKAGITGVRAKVHLDTKHSLPGYEAREGEPSCSGGVIVTSLDRVIVCDNSLDARLNLVVQQSLPQLRNILYGSA